MKSKGFIETVHAIHIYLGYTIAIVLDSVSLSYCAMQYFAEASNFAHSHGNSVSFERTASYSPGTCDLFRDFFYIAFAMFYSNCTEYYDQSLLLV